MFLKDIELVTEKVKQYGLKLPFLDLGGLKFQDVTVADYSRTLASGVQHDRYLKLKQDPFAHIAGEHYNILNPQYGDPAMEDLQQFYPDVFGTVVCLNVIEHVVNPFVVFPAIYKIVARGGLVIITTVFSFPLHKSPLDNWRYSPDCLKMLGEVAGFEVLEADFHMQIWGDAGIKELHTGHAQEIQAVYCVLRKP